MHVADMVEEANFRVQTGGATVDLAALVPEWSPTDRLGIVLDRPYGALDASLLIQIGALRFYDAVPAGRDSSPQYPQIYLFHVGGPHGDFSSFDVWPGRHEVFIEEGEPFDLLGAINDRAITHLALPQTNLGDLSYIANAPSGWSDASYARDRIKHVLLYALKDEAETDLIAETTEPQLLFMSRVNVDVEGSYHYFNSLTDQEILDMEVGPSSAWDIRRWLELYVERGDEVALAHRTQLLESLDAERTRQVFRISDVETALRTISGIASTSPEPRP